VHITPEIVEAVYELLRLTPPFKRWKLPHVDEIKIVLTHKDDHFAEFADSFVLYVSLPNNRDLATLISSVAHEMTHLQDYRHGPTPQLRHGKDFKRLAAQVCRAHGFDPAAF
jgi:hypothetical protein